MKREAAQLGLVAACVVLVSAATASATVTPVVNPFVGDLTEDWESFDNYVDGGVLASPALIMGGGATITHPSMFVYEPGVADFPISGFNANSSDGSKGLGINAGSAVVIEFASPVSQLGAYWGSAGTGINLTFLDENGDQIGTDGFSYDASAEAGNLIWHGWASDTAIKSVAFSGSLPVVDGLQAILYAPVPAPGALALLGLGALVGRRRRR